MPASSSSLPNVRLAVLQNIGQKVTISNFALWRIAYLCYAYVVLCLSTRISSVMPSGSSGYDGLKLISIIFFANP